MQDPITPPLPFAQDGESKVELFKAYEVRKIFQGGEWWFSVKDVVEALTDTPDGTRYVADLRKRDRGLDEGYSDITRTLKFGSTGGRQETTFINIEGLFRLLQSVPSPKVDPFKRWLAKVGFERIQEVQNPELAIRRAIVLFKAKGYSDEWIEARIQNKLSREQLEAEWGKRGIKEPKHYGLLTDAIAVETFGLHINEHRAVKGLKAHHSLRDNMTPIELTLTTLGEQATKEIAKSSNAQGVEKNLLAAKRGGHIAGTARLQIEQETKKPVVSSENYLTERQRKNASLSDGFHEVVKKIVEAKKPQEDK